MFSVGDEISVFDDSDDYVISFGEKRPMPFGLKKGDVFRVLAVLPEGTMNGHYSLNQCCIQIGIANPSMEALSRLPYPVDTTDCWSAARFRKIEKKRDRAELYTLLGISDMLNGKARELTHV